MTDLKKKTLWQCRRGLWELDAILTPFVENHFQNLDINQQNLLIKLLSYEDIDIFDSLVTKKQVDLDNEMTKLVNLILSKHLETTKESI